MIRLGLAFGRRAVERLKRSGGTRYDRTLLQEAIAAKLAAAASLDTPEGERERAQEISQCMLTMLEEAQAKAKRRASLHRLVIRRFSSTPLRRLRGAPRQPRPTPTRRRDVDGSQERSQPPEPEPKPKPLEAGLYTRQSTEGKWVFSRWRSAFASVLAGVEGRA